MSTRRKRIISSCVPCYTRKQKCNRGYPCNHCTRRQRTEGCYYYAANGSRTTTPPVQPDIRGEGNLTGSLHGEWDVLPKSSLPTTNGSWAGPSLAESFGYFQGSDSNTLALIQKVGLAHQDGPSGAHCTLSPEDADEVHRNLERMPDRQILNFLVQYFAAEVNWVEQLVQIPWFLAKYQKWWTAKRINTVTEVDFGVLILRICSYTLQFLPSPGYTLDAIRGVSLAEIRNICDETADNLESIASAAETRGSLIRVQHIAFFALQCQIEAKTDSFRDILGRALRTAHNIGIHLATADAQTESDIALQDMQRRTFCSLFIWDSLLSRQLDRIPSHPERLRPENWPQPRPHPVDNSSTESIQADKDGSTIDPFTERILQARLADFWRSLGPIQGANYDMIVAEERYDKLCADYLSQLPTVFALIDPDESHDKRLPKLPLQRRLLHIRIYDSIYWNFRPLLLRKPVPLPVYKSIILSSQKRKLAAAALLALENVKQLHTLLGSCHTRLTIIPFTTFEAAVLLVLLYADPMFEEDCPPQHLPPPGILKTDPLQATICCMTRSVCVQAINGAVERLKMLAEISSMADMASNTLNLLWANVTEAGPSTGNGSGADETTFPPGKETSRNGIAETATTAAGTSSSGTIENAAHQTTGFEVPLDPAAWLPNDLGNVTGISDVASLEANPAAEEMGTWQPFDAAGVYAHHPWVSMDFQ